jgi:hypothetical protein
MYTHKIYVIPNKKGFFMIQKLELVGGTRSLRLNLFFSNTNNIVANGFSIRERSKSS